MGTMRYMPYVSWDVVASCAWYFAASPLEGCFHGPKGGSKHPKRHLEIVFYCINSVLSRPDPGPKATGGKAPAIRFSGAPEEL